MGVGTRSVLESRVLAHGAVTVRYRSSLVFISKKQREWKGNIHSEASTARPASDGMRTSVTTTDIACWECLDI